MYNLERSCKTQVALLSSGARLTPVSDDLAEHTARQYESMTKDRGNPDMPDPEWEAYLRLALKHHPGPRTIRRAGCFPIHQQGDYDMTTLRILTTAAAIAAASSLAAQENPKSGGTLNVVIQPEPPGLMLGLLQNARHRWSRAISTKACCATTRISTRCRRWRRNGAVRRRADLYLHPAR